MIVLELKQVIFIGLLAILLAAWLAISLEHRQQAHTLHGLSAEDLTQLREALNAAPFGLLLLDRQGAVLYTNVRARQLAGLTMEDTSLPAAPWRDELEQDLISVRQSGALQPHYRTLVHSPEYALSWWICPLPALNLLVISDVSRQHKADQAARAFLGNLSHELRTPLTAILTHLAVLRAADVPEPARQVSLDIIHQETSRMARLVPALLELSRLEIAEPLSLRPLDLALVAEDAIAQVILEAEARDILIELDIPSPLPRVLGDPDRLKQVFLNLLENAVKFGRAGDKIEVVLCAQPRGVRVTIRDTGPGIPAEHLPNVTQRFYRVRTDVAGSGLGLALAQEILRQHNTRLEIESRAIGEHTGTTVTFSLPIA